MLKKDNRLSTTYEFNKVRREGESFRSKNFMMFYLDVSGYDGPTRVGIVVSTKYSKVAPVRNRVKRVFREVVRLNLDKIKDGYWLVIQPFKSATEKGYEEINTEFNKALSQIPISS
jgi:ribonuclease P protein component